VENAELPSWRDMQRREPSVRAGQRFECLTCSIHVILLDPGSSADVPCCGGLPMRTGRPIPCSEVGSSVSDHPAILAGDIYKDARTGLTVQCTRTGYGPLSLYGRVLQLHVTYAAGLPAGEFLKELRAAYFHYPNWAA
jgi:hypothetical protein